MKLMATIPLIDPHAALIAAHPAVDALRFNTIVPRPPRWSHKNALERLLTMCKGKPLVIDLKGRQLRVTQWADPWFHHITLSHEIEVETPAPIYFRDSHAVIRHVDGKKILLTDAPEKALGAGQAVNIRHPSLKVKGFLTEDDLKYREAAKELGIHTIALSFVEQLEDITEYLEFDPEVQLWAKIENERGVEMVRQHWPSLKGRAGIMIARGDLFENSGDDPTQYFGWEESLLAADPEAIVASRILQSCESSPTASLEDLRELAFHFSRGTSQIMLADGVCKSAEAFEAAANAYLQFRDYWESRAATPAGKGGSDGSRAGFWSWLRG